MISSRAIDSNTLTWVQPEIEGTLKQACHALEAFAGNPLDIDQIRLCAKQIRQVRGTLQMIELAGPALLAEEMEQLAHVLADDPGQAGEDTCELLMRAILQLPDYLERLQMGQQDHPLALRPLINELRAARQQQPLPELTSWQARFEPDLNIFKPADQNSSFTVPKIPGFETDSRAMARKLRPSYQLSLVNWHRNPQGVEHVAQLGRIVQRLEETSSARALIQLWWVTGAVLEALAAGGLPPAAPVPLLGQVDRQIKRLIDLGEEEWAAEPPTALVKDLLLHVAQAQSSGPRVTQI